VTGVTGEGSTVVRGRSLSGIPLGDDESTTPVFVQRLGGWARPPGALPHTHVAGPAGVLGEQFVFLGGGEATGPAAPAAGDFYDMLSLGGASSSFPVVPETIVSRGRSALFIHEKGASVIDDQGATPIAAPVGQSFAEVAGGRPVEAADGRTFVVGATRRSKPTRAVLIVGADGALSAVSLLEARVGAAALWVQGVGLVVAGGSATGAGVEVLADGATSFLARDYPADPIEGAGAVLDPRGGIALIGGADPNGMAAPTRALDPACKSDCSPAPVKNADLPAPLGGVSVFGIGGGRVMAVGDEIGGKGMTRSFLVDLHGAVAELALREPRSGASVIPAPNGTLSLLGGLHEDGSAALSVELFFPE